MKTKKMFLLMLSIFTIASPAVVSAQNLSPIPTEIFSPGIQLYGNQTGYKYLTIGGKRFKRLWSYTYGRWEEPAWTPA